MTTKYPYSAADLTTYFPASRLALLALPATPRGGRTGRATAPGGR